jgi:transposase
MAPPPDLADKDALIATLVARIEILAARVAELEAKLGAPPKGPDNSSVPPSRGEKGSGSGKAKAKRKPHRGTHRSLHPNPTRRCDVKADVCQGCGADVSGAAQGAVETYEHIEIPKIEPDVTRVVVNILSAARPAFAEQADRLKADLKQGAVIASDETGLRVGKKNTWLWVFHDGPTALFLANQSRAKAVVEDFLGDWRPDYWISDRYGGQRGWALKDHQYCLAHLIRDTRYQREAGDTIIAPAFMGLLKRACAIGRRRGELDDVQLKTHRVKLVGRLSRILTLTPDSDPGRKMIKIIKKTRRHLFVFITNRALSATNNGSERALRPCAVYRKITNGFRSESAASLYADIRSVVETGRRRQVRAIDAIRLTLSVSPIPNPA